MICLRCRAQMFRVVNEKGTAHATCSKCCQYVECASCPACKQFVTCVPCYNAALKPKPGVRIASSEPLIPSDGDL